MFLIWVKNFTLYMWTFIFLLLSGFRLTILTSTKNKIKFKGIKVGKMLLVRNVNISHF